MRGACQIITFQQEGLPVFFVSGDHANVFSQRIIHHQSASPYRFLWILHKIYYVTFLERFSSRVIDLDLSQLLWSNSSNLIIEDKLSCPLPSYNESGKPLTISAILQFWKCFMALSAINFLQLFKSDISFQSTCKQSLKQLKRIRTLRS